MIRSRRSDTLDAPFGLTWSLAWEAGTLPPRPLPEFAPPGRAGAARKTGS